MTFLSILIYKRKSALNKKRLASGEGSIGGASVVTFHGNVISFSNPVLEADRQMQQHDNSLVEELHSSPLKLPQREMTDVMTTTFTNPVYDHAEALDSFDDDSSRRTKFENVDTGKMFLL
uniref:MADS-box domain-containing protein n=1 Tax=Meloidogyne hapla TaxID=6305 RepID=A0A1I8BLW5_MELHA